MEARICKTYRLEAAHVLPNHGGKCRRLHGHSYRIDVEAYGPVKPADGSASEGMVLDFGDISATWRTLIHDRLDHQLLNEVLPDIGPTTAENLAVWMLAELRGVQPAICAVRVYETVTSWAEARW